MRILFWSQNPLTLELGASKHRMELAGELQRLGWTCTLLDPSVTSPDRYQHSGVQRYLACVEGLRKYLREHGADYDVVDYAYEYLPFQRCQFSPRTLFVARSVLLLHHLDVITIPAGRGWRAQAGRLIRSRSRRAERRLTINHATVTMREADMVNVGNDADRKEIARRGIPEGKVVVLPCGISRQRHRLFSSTSSVPPGPPVIAFVGTFDYRKGAREFPAIVKSILARVPDARFRLLGTKGLFKTREEVLAFFPRPLRATIEVIPSFRPDDLPGLLAPCSLGIFPSHLEGFGFGVLEMLAASLPVVAYDAPGPPMMLTPEYLVARGDIQGMCDKVVGLLKDKATLSRAREMARRRSGDFYWEDIARKTSDHYSRCVTELRRAGKAGYGK